jgi:hypothetical protein
VLVYGGQNLSSIAGVSTVTTPTLVGFDLSKYSALYVEAPSGCCTSNPGALTGFGSSVNDFISAGGNFSIENYSGGDFDGVVPGGLGQFESFGASTIYGTTCTDGETVNANGIAKGFTQPPVDHCWSHQGYQSSYWLPLGYISLIDADPTFTYGDGSHAGSSLLARGGTLGAPTSVPEPLTLSMFGFGLAGAFMMRRKVKKA